MVGREEKREFPRRSRATAGVALVVSCLASASARGGDVVPASVEVDAFVAEALTNSPELAATRREADAARSRIAPAGALPDPMLTVFYENDGASFSLGTEPMTRLSFLAQQAIPLGGRRGLAEGVARADAERAGTRPARAALSLEGAVRRAYADLLAARENLRLDDDQIDTWRSVEESIRARYSAGLGSQQDVLRAQSERTRLLQQRRRDEASEKTALVLLRRLLARDAGAPIPTAARLLPGSLPGAVPGADVLPRAFEETPELKDSSLAKERAGLAADLARRSGWPELVASAGYSYRGALPLMWSAGVGVSVPLWSSRRQKPMVAEAEAMRDVAASNETALRREIRARVEERLVVLQQLSDESRLDVEGVLAQDRLAVDSALSSYRAGTAPFVTVLEALGTLFTDRRAAVSRLAGFIRVEADLNELSLERK